MWFASLRSLYGLSGLYDLGWLRPAGVLAAGGPWPTRRASAFGRIAAPETPEGGPSVAERSGAARLTPPWVFSGAARAGAAP